MKNKLPGQYQQKVDPQATQWENIFKRDGHVFPEPAPIVMKFAAQLKARGSKTVLDIGCGTGRHVVQLAKNGFRTYGLDNSPTALRLTRAWLDEENVSAGLILADARYSLPFQDESFDAVLSTQVIHHALLTTVRGTAAEIGRVTKKGGSILITVPARRALEEDHDQHIEVEPNTYVPTDGSEKGLPHHIFSPEELQGIFPEFEATSLQIVAGKIIVLEAHRSG